MSEKVVELRPARGETRSGVAADQVWELRRSFLSIRDDAIRATIVELVKSVALSQDNGRRETEAEHRDR